LIQKNEPLRTPSFSKEIQLLPKISTDPHLGNFRSTFADGASVIFWITKTKQATSVAGSLTLVMNSFNFYSLIAAGGVVAVGTYALLRRKPKKPAELERERRTWLDGIGRITDGTVIDVQEMAQNDDHHAAVLLIYKYDVAGVSYECSQDVTYLRQWINLHSCRLGLPTSVKYDPHNPGNSLVVSESWMGLRQ
jgi:hypothetical protein